MSRRAVFLVLFAPVAIGAFVPLAAAGGEGSAAASMLAAAAAAVISYGPALFTIGGVCAMAAAALLRARASRDGDAAPSGWIALAGFLWLVSVVALRAQAAISVVLVWAAVSAGAVAVAEASVLQRRRVRAGRSTLPPPVVVAGAILLFLVQPILVPVVAMLVTIRARQEESAPVGEDELPPSG